MHKNILATRVYFPSSSSSPHHRKYIDILSVESVCICMPFTPFNNYRTSIMPFPQFFQPFFYTRYYVNHLCIVLFGFEELCWLWFFFSSWLKNYGKFTWKWEKNDWQTCTSIAQSRWNIRNRSYTNNNNGNKNEEKHEYKANFPFLKKEAGRKGQLSYHFDRNLVQWPHSALRAGDDKI